MNPRNVWNALGNLQLGVSSCTFKSKVVIQNAALKDEGIIGSTTVFISTRSKKKFRYKKQTNPNEMRSWAHFYMSGSPLCCEVPKPFPRYITRKGHPVYVCNGRAIEKINVRVARRRKADGNSRGTRGTQLFFATRCRATKQIHIYSRKLSNAGRIGAKRTTMGIHQEKVEDKTEVLRPYNRPSPLQCTFILNM